MVFVRVSFLVVLLGIGVMWGFGALFAAPGDEAVVFQAKDPAGDDHGPGSYTYPKNRVFVEHQGLFDLTGFRVSHDAEYVYFDLGFEEITNPWNAPEGFSHQLIDIYIATGAKGGRSETLGAGPNVSFSRGFPWHFEVKSLAWGGSRVFTSNDTPESGGIAEGVRAEVMPDGKTIRISVSKAIIGEPKPSWRYYVLVGSQDAFGINDWRPVMEKAGDWVFGGGSDLEVNPNVIDMLVPEGWRPSQEDMLGSYDARKGSLAVLRPVGGGGGGRLFRGFVVLIMVAVPIFVVTVVWLIRRRPPHER